jgi:hypothetical protein
MLGGKPTFRTIGYDLDGARQQPGVRRILGMEPTGIEPVTSCFAKRPLPGPTSALKVAALRGFRAVGLGAKISADVRGLSAIIVVSGTFGDECLERSGRTCAQSAAYYAFPCRV